MALWTRTPSPGKTRNSPILFLARQLETSSLQGSFWLQVGPVEAAEEGSAAETVSSVSDEVRFTTYAFSGKLVSGGRGRRMQYSCL